MTPKDRKAKAILKLLTDMKWPDWEPHFSGVHGGLEVAPGHPRGVSGNVLVRSNEVYVGCYSALADAIRDWQHTPAKEA